MTPWYDSKAICLMGLIVMVAVFLFALIGVSVASEIEAYQRHMFIPLILMLVSLGGLIIFSIKLARQSSPKRGG
jgi:FtsH-binding integral membrane protein